MKQTKPPLEIVRPCSVDWHTMSGDARKRFCAGCQKHVFNLSAMTQREAEKFAEETQGRECIAYISADAGKIHTPNFFERSLLWLSHRLPRVAAVCAIFVPAALMASAEQGKPILKGRVGPRTEENAGKGATPVKPKVNPPPPPVTAGVPAPPPPTKEKPMKLGEPAAPEQPGKK